MLRVLFVCLCLSLPVAGSFADETAAWSRFRGGLGTGHGQGQPPSSFGPSKNLRWNTALRGIGWSSPVVAEGKIWLTSAEVTPASAEFVAEKEAAGLARNKQFASKVSFFAQCIELNSGRVLHDILLSQTDAPEPINPLNSYASPTPVISEGRVYCDFGNYGTWCLDLHSGQKVWHRQIAVDYSVGPGSSPIVYKDLLILVCDGIDDQFILALHKQSGQEVWRTQRPPMRTSEVEFQKAYSTPLVLDVEGQEQIIVPGAQWLCGYEPSTGNEIWRFDHGRGFSVSPSPVATSDGFVVFSTGFMRPELVAVDPRGEGDITQTHQKWRVSRGVPTKPSPIAVGDRLYMISDKGVLSQIRTKDGSLTWQERIPGQYSASPVFADQRLFFCSHEGKVTVIEDSGEFAPLTENQLEDQIMASPAMVGNDILIRCKHSLYLFGAAEK